MRSVTTSDNRDFVKELHKAQYTPYIADILAKGVLPQYRNHVVNNRIEHFYVWYGLPCNRLLVYHKNKLIIAKGYTKEGYYQADEDCGVYVIKTFENLLSRGKIGSDRQLVIQAKFLVSRCQIPFPQY